MSLLSDVNYWKTIEKGNYPLRECQLCWPILSWVSEPSWLSNPATSAPVWLQTFTLFNSFQCLSSWLMHHFGWLRWTSELIVDIKSSSDLQIRINQGWQVPKKQKRFRCQSSDQAWTLSGWVFFSGFKDICWICMNLLKKSALFK